MSSIAPAYSSGAIEGHMSDHNPVRLEAAESSLQHAERVLLKNFVQAPTPFAILDAEGRVRHLNPAFAALLQRSQDELQGQPFGSLLDPVCREEWLHSLQCLIQGAAASSMLDTYCLRVAQSALQIPIADPRAPALPVPFEDSIAVRADLSLLTGAQPVNDESPPPSPSVVLILHDQSLLIQAQRAMVKTEPLTSLGRLSASIAHELNNPLESVNNLLYLIAHSEDVEEVRRYTRMAEEEMARVTRIANQTLRFYRPQAAPAEVHMADVLESVLVLFEGRLRRQQITVTRDYQSGVPPLVTYSGELRQVFVNLVSNALDAMGENGTLRISLHSAGHCAGPFQRGLRVTVSDSGCGIPQGLLQKVFEPFFTTKEASGTGLGLWITRDIVRRHGGTLRVRSAVSGPRRGTTMSIFLPAAEEEHAPLSTSSAA